jgi:hypothetical protein
VKCWRRKSLGQKKHKNERNQNLVEIVKEGAQVTKEGRRKKKRDI